VNRLRLIVDCLFLGLWFGSAAFDVLAFAATREPGCAVFAILSALFYDSLLSHVRQREQ
jgi:hypothetical protein